MLHLIWKKIVIEITSYSGKWVDAKSSKSLKFILCEKRCLWTINDPLFDGRECRVVDGSGELLNIISFFCLFHFTKKISLLSLSFLFCWFLPSQVPHSSIKQKSPLRGHCLVWMWCVCVCGYNDRHSITLFYILFGYDQIKVNIYINRRDG